MALPQELIEEIIDYVGDNTPTLRACSLVASSWVVPARRHIFRAIVVSKKTGDTGDADGVLSFIRVQRAASIRHSVRELTIQYQNVTLPLLLAAIRSLDRLDRLSLRFLAIGMDDPARPPFHPSGKSIGKLEIFMCTIPGVHTLLELLDFFDAVSELFILHLMESAVAPDTRPAALRTYRKNTHIRCLHIDNNVQGETFAAMCAKGLTSVIDEQGILTLTVRLTPLVHHLRRELVSLSSPTLQELILLVDSSPLSTPNEVIAPESFSLSSCADLESITFQFRVSLNYPLWICAFSILATLPRTAPLSTIVVQFIFLGSERSTTQLEQELSSALDDPGWEMLGPMVRKFQSFRHAKVVLDDFVSPPWVLSVEMSDKLANRLASLGKGIKWEVLSPDGSTACTSDNS
ncbi:hypothetical protein BXZ70DRAFT_437244 [Cristinia sonorae]|uniref:F-box domain-containing protein n=1 Tax=Cristinia sonorae TaxID=1940300 RepID=A0A8K0UI43_9AGAR|nr:hypothetical protein BXZ70DRAFT_437244 [Cristinia sonorae]